MGESSLAGRLIALGDLSLLADVSLPREQLLTLFASKLHALFDARALAVWLYDAERGMVVLDYSHGFADKTQEGDFHQEMDIKLFPEVKFAIDSGTVWTTEDMEDSQLFTSPKMQQIMSDLKVNAVMGVPLRALKQKLGALSFYYKEAREFSDNEKALALAYANALALSLNNVEAYNNLVASERMKSEIIGVVAHQFRTPIAVLRGNVELLRSVQVCAKSPEATSFIDEIEKVGFKLRTFVENFLNVRAIDEGRLEPHMQQLDFGEAVMEALESIETYRKQHDITIKREISKGVQVTADSMLLSEAVLNVITNAIKYAKSEAVVTVAADTGAKEARLSVKDDGVGIPQKEQRLIFQKLFRASNVARHPEASSGLGLYIARQYLAKQGGRIWFESSGENKGTTFYITLPLT